MITTHEKGAQRLEEFLQKRIESNKVGFYEPITKLKLQTFWSLQKVKSVQVKDQTVAIKSDRQTFARLLMVQQNRNIDIKHVLNYELGSVPHSIANQDGTLRKSVKSKLLDFLEKDILQVESLLSGTVFIFDGMVMFQKLPPQLKTFGEISDYILRTIVKEGDGRWVFFVTGRYFPDSVKLLERQRQTRSEPIKVNVTRRNQLKPLQFDKFLKCSENKKQLVNFLANDWSIHKNHAVFYHIWKQLQKNPKR